LTRRDPDHAVIFDMDGVILDSEPVWQQVMHELFAAHHRRFTDFDQSAFMGGDNSRQWASYLRLAGGIPLDDQEILAWVIGRLMAHFSERLPMMPGAVAAVTRLASSYRLALASSSPREVIAFVLERSGLQQFFVAWASSDDVPRGKPAPDVYLRACALIQADPFACVAVEDSSVGIQAAHAAGLKVIAIPHPSVPSDPACFELADLALPSIRRLEVETVRSVLLSCPER
jgi:HAD superfamily hydrolase (TIGR01509 family)